MLFFWNVPEVHCQLQAKHNRIVYVQAENPWIWHGLAKLGTYNRLCHRHMYFKFCISKQFLVVDKMN